MRKPVESTLGVLAKIISFLSKKDQLFNFEKEKRISFCLEYIHLVINVVGSDISSFNKINFKAFLVIQTFVIGLLPIYAQEYKTRADLLHDMEWDDTDAVIMNGERYLINNSFLINFKGYKDIFPEIPKVEEMRLSVDISSDYDMPYRPFCVIDNTSTEV